jgi:pyruvate/2-oxoglutarate dehydrogenase complex dihydrolipoamide dehydrogenase (E3) component
MPKSRPDYDLCVIGGGAAGLVVAAGGAQLGAKVILVEKHDRLGGDCLWHGCIPSKALLASARAAQAMRNARRFGLDPVEPAVDLPRVMQRVRRVIMQVAVHDDPERFRKLGIEVVFGAGSFTSPTAFDIDGRAITARHFVIATGSRPTTPALPGIEGVPFLTSDSLFALEAAVPELLIIGGGPTGVEMAQAFARLGSRVTVVESGPHILAREDPDLASIVATRLNDEGVRILTHCHALSAEGDSQGPALRVRHAIPNDSHPGVHKAPVTHALPSELRGTHLLVTTGRSANVEGLGLDAAGVELANGRIRTDARLRTSAPHIFACGDVTGPYLFTHMAEHQAGVVLRNALFRLPAKVETRTIPWCTFTDPELARVGLSETEARRQGVRHRVYFFPFSGIDRARTDAEPEGLAKIVTTPRGRLLGAAIAGPQAGELIHEYALALGKGMKASDLSGVIHIYPTLAQINRKVADERMKARLTPLVRWWIKRLFRLRG